MTGHVNVQHPYENRTLLDMMRQITLLKAELEWYKTRLANEQAELANLIDGVANGEERYAQNRKGERFYFVRADKFEEEE